jgi:hypothetical protein
VWALIVVKGQVIADPLASFAGAVIVFQVDFFVLDRTPQPLGENIVYGSSPAVHADLDLGIQQALSVFRTGKVAALITVPDLLSATVI